MYTIGTIASRTPTGTVAAFDHAINLIDTTKPNDVSADDPFASPTQSISSTDASRDSVLNKKWNKGTLREELARRKYAKWQESKYDDNGRTADTNEVTATRRDGEREGGQEFESQKSNDPKRPSTRVDKLRDKIPFKSRRSGTKALHQEDQEIDILYENQRGSFLCGIPLYSSRSLLNFDPSPWQTANFTASPVSIIDSQLPDPSWTWVWKTWYVDMSHDVDEEGWQYSFSFQQGFSWHGNHPWFHSFVRRRRWLRKRVKVHHLERHGHANDMKEAHKLTEDYFTIHATRERSRETSRDRTSQVRSSVLAAYLYESEGLQDLDDISNIGTLLVALKVARLDREKIAAVKAFLVQGGEELYYLADRMEDVMAVFVYQSSRHQFLNTLFEALNDAIRQKDEDQDRSETETAMLEHRIDNLKKAVHTADEHVKDLEYWSDIRNAAQQAIGTGHGHNTTELKDHIERTGSLDGTSENLDRKTSEVEGELSEGIKGIPEQAETSVEPGLDFKKGNTGAGTSMKGKERA